MSDKYEHAGMHGMQTAKLLSDGVVERSPVLCDPCVHRPFVSDVVIIERFAIGCVGQADSQPIEMRRKIRIVRVNIQIDYARMIRSANQGRVEGSCHCPDGFASRVNNVTLQRLPTLRLSEILRDLPAGMGSQDEQR
ncbi:hypothetical protein SAMN05192539_105926 [Paraburkholderia diazotrophica]|uniref:Uncharacterized protein n=1 Tax=Paraburkholderia diazotrophica TaxID=667676 RepID=A0A1H7EPI5_9BURK|nr:hypothetical protein SAMN05192539_105926 [Paraburkholderia diazotrophica]